MGRIKLNHPEAHEKLTARLFYKQVTARGYVDAGNVKEYADATSRSLVTRVETRRGTRHVDAEVVDTNHEAWTFLLDEHNKEQEQLLRLARSESTQVQPQAEGQTAAIESVEVDRWFEIGSYNVANLRVTASRHGPCEEGEDYEVDRKAGRIKVLDTGSVGDGEDLILSFDRPEVTFERSTSKQQPLFYCDFIVEEYNQFSGLFLRRHKFRGYLNASEFPTQSGDFAGYRVRVTARGAVVTDKRMTSDTVEDFSGATGVAGESSSESSLSSSSSRSSRSSLSSSSEVSYTSSLSSSTTGSSQSSSAVDPKSASSSSSSSSNSHSSSSSSSTSSEGDQSDGDSLLTDGQGDSGSL